MNHSDSRSQSLVEEFKRRFEATPAYVTIGPGRVNLIGEHTDYNDGYVLPVALKRDIRLVLRRRPDRQVRVFSLEYDSWLEFDLDQLQYNAETLWGNYIQGVAWALAGTGIDIEQGLMAW